MKRLLWIVGLLTICYFSYSQIDTIQNNESGLSVRTKLNATILQVNSLVSASSTDSSFVELTTNIINEWTAATGVTIDGTLIKDYTIAPFNSDPAQYLTADGDEISLYAGSTEIIDIKSTVTTISNDFRPTADGTLDNGAVGFYWQTFYTELVRFSEQTDPGAPAANTGVLYMDSSDEHIYFRNSAAAYDLTEGVGGDFDTTYIHARIDSIWTEIEDTVNIGDVAVLLADTIPIATFGGGNGTAESTSVFTTSSYYGTFYNGSSDTLVVTEMRCVLKGSTPSVGVQIHWHADHGSGSSTDLNTVVFTVTSTTEGDSDVSFANSAIPPGVFVWCTTPTVTAAPTYMSITLMGYKI